MRSDQDEVEGVKVHSPPFSDRADMDSPPRPEKTYRVRSIAAMEAPTLGVGPSEDGVRARGVEGEAVHVSAVFLS